MQWYEVVLGTPASIEAWLAQQKPDDQQAQWEAQAKTRRTCKAREIGSKPTTGQKFDGAIA